MAMAKKVKFALEMANGAQVRSNLEDLRKNFDMESVTNYFLSGKLAQWLEDRYYDEEAEKVKGLDKDAPNFQKQLCAALGVPYDGEDELDEDQRKRLEEKKALLRQKTSDENIIALAAKTAFNQEDLADLLDMEESPIYLCGKSFDIPIRMTGKTYIGFFGKPKVRINANSIEELRAKQIVFDNIELDERLQSKPQAPAVQAKSPKKSAEPKPQGASPQTIQAAKELLEALKKNNYAAWEEGTLPFLAMPFSQNKREMEQELKQAAKDYQDEMWDVLHDEVHEKISVLKGLQHKYDEILEDKGVEYLPVNPDINTVSDQLEYALAETQQWRPSTSLGSELVSNARYEKVESSGFSGIFGGTDTFLKNERELMGISTKYYRQFERHLENTSGGKLVKAYLESMRENLKEITMH